MSELDAAWVSAVASALSGLCALLGLIVAAWVTRGSADREKKAEDRAVAAEKRAKTSDERLGEEYETAKVERAQERRRCEHDEEIARRADGLLVELEEEATERALDSRGDVKIGFPLHSQLDLEAARRLRQRGDRVEVTATKCVFTATAGALLTEKEMEIYPQRRKPYEVPARALAILHRARVRAERAGVALGETYWLYLNTPLSRAAGDLLVERGLAQHAPVRGCYVRVQTAEASERAFPTSQPDEIDVDVIDVMLEPSLPAAPGDRPTEASKSGEGKRTVSPVVGDDGKGGM